MMKPRTRTVFFSVTACFILLVSTSTGAIAGNLTTYRVTLENLTSGQPLSPPVAATHKNNVKVFTIGKPVSPEAELLAENGDQLPLFWQLTGLHNVTDVVDIGAPLLPAGTGLGGSADRATFDIEAGGGDRLSLATMLVCTNDGLAGVDRLRLPKGARAYRLLGLDAGSEENTELSIDLPDPCSVLGPVPLAGDPNGNENIAVDTTPHQPVGLHEGLSLTGDLMPVHAWSGPVAKLTVVRLADDRTRRYSTELSGFAETPPAATDGGGSADFDHRGGDSLEAHLEISGLTGVTGAHLHLGAPGVNGPVVATLYSPQFSRQGRRPGGGNGHPRDDLEIELTIRESDLDGGPFAGDFDGFIEALGAGNLYVNVHTPTYPGGELRGQVGADN